MKEALALIAAVLAIIGNIPYLRDVLSKKIQPHPYTWFVWTLVSGIVFFGQVAKGAGIGAVPTAASELFTLLIFFSSLRYGFKRVTKIDTIFLAIALTGLVPWFITKDPTVSVIIAVSIDLVAFVPTIRKTWQFPATENRWLYAMNVIRHILALGALRTYNVATVLHSAVMIAVNTLMSTILLIRPKPKL